MLKLIPNINKLVTLALAEDFYFGDITTNALSKTNKSVKAAVILEEEGIIAGLELVEMVFQKLKEEVTINLYTQDGNREKASKVILELEGRASVILTAERTILNFLARLSGIATAAAQYVSLLQGTKCRLLDTRKTTPGWRYLDKYATQLAGVVNHRFGLDSGILIKDNHLHLFASLGEAVEEIRKKVSPLNKIAVEAENETQVKEALKYKVDHILLDNMSSAQLREMVLLIEGKAQTEASGGINLANLKEYAATGVDFISLGALTTTVRFLTMKLEITR